MQEGLYPYLVVEKRNNDYEYVNIADLDICKNVTYTSLNMLDNILKLFTEDELRESITRSNTLSISNIDDKKILIKYGNYKLPLLTKNIVGEFDLYNYVVNNFEDKVIRNDFYNKLASIVTKDSKENRKNKESDPLVVLFKRLLDEGNLKEFCYSLSYLSYPELREFYFYYYNKVAKTEKILDNMLIRESK